MRRQRIENFGVTLRPGVVDRYAPKAPFLAVAHELAIVPVHKQRKLRSGTRALARHEMLRHDISIKGSRIAADLDLKIAHSVTGIERPNQGKNGFKDGVTTSHPGKVDPELSPRGREIETAIFR